MLHELCLQVGKVLFTNEHLRIEIAQAGEESLRCWHAAGNLWRYGLLELVEVVHEARAEFVVKLVDDEATQHRRAHRATYRAEELHRGCYHTHPVYREGVLHYQRV